MTAPHLIVFSMLILAAGAVLTGLLAGRRTLAGWVAFMVAAVASGLIVFAAGKTLWSGPDSAVTFCAVQAAGSAWRIYVDGLSAIFLILIALVAIPAAFYSIQYLDHYPDYGVARYYPNLLLFLAGMIGLITTSDAMLFFCLFWQLMTLTSFWLIRFEHRKVENRRAAWKYLILMQIACVMIMLGASLLAPGGGATGKEVLAKYDFDSLSENIPTLLATRSGWVFAAFALFLAGFGIKAGMWPFGQIWLPDAHPAAPSPVSALLSGVMIKTGVYGLIRNFLWLFPFHKLSGGVSEPWAVQAMASLSLWGWIIAALGTVTLVTGTAQALRQGQTKRMLAYSSIGQVGYILLGLGICLTLINSPLMTVATLGLYGALYHTLNHGVFKGLLFLNAGSMLCATGTQDMNRLGGLVKYMPLTALFTAVGVVSIAGALLGCGFASKWCLYGAAILGGKAVAFLPICALFAVMTSALTLAVFVRFFGACFLSRTSATVKEYAQNKNSLEVGWMLLLPKFWLAGLCIAFGLFPMFCLSLIQAALNASRQGLGGRLADAAPATAGVFTGMSADHQLAIISPLAVAGVLFAMVLLARGLSKLGGARRRTSVPWFCGYAREAEHNRYQARHFFGSIQRYLRWLGWTPGPSKGDK